MWRWRAEVVVVGIDRQRLACWIGGQLREVSLGGGDSPPTPTALKEALQTLMEARRPPQRIELCAAPDLCRHWVFEAPSSVRSFSELQLLARMRAAQLFGSDRESAADWVVTADWRSRGRMFAAALPSVWLDSVRQASQALGCGLQLRSANELALASCVAINRGRVLAWESPQHLALAIMDGDAVLAWRCVRRPLALTPSQRTSLLAEQAAALAFSFGLPAMPAPLLLAPWTEGDGLLGTEAAWAAHVGRSGLLGVEA